MENRPFSKKFRQNKKQFRREFVKNLQPNRVVNRLELVILRIYQGELFTQRNTMARLLLHVEGMRPDWSVWYCGVSKLIELELAM